MRSRNLRTGCAQLACKTAVRDEWLERAALRNLLWSSHIGPCFLRHPTPHTVIPTANRWTRAEGLGRKHVILRWVQSIQTQALFTPAGGVWRLSRRDEYVAL